MTKIMQRHIEMIHPHGFDKLFEKQIRISNTYEEAFNQLNSEYMSVYGTPRYASYESYRQSRRQRIKT